MCNYNNTVITGQLTKHYAQLIIPHLEYTLMTIMHVGMMQTTEHLCQLRPLQPARHVTVCNLVNQFHTSQHTTLKHEKQCTQIHHCCFLLTTHD